MIDDNAEYIKRATIKEAAMVAGVSIASVSRALNNKSGISDKTRERILKVCTELNYIPNASARELTGVESNVVAVSMGPQDYPASRYLGMLWPYLSAELLKKGKTLVPIIESMDMESFSNIGGAILFGVEHNDPRINYLKKRDIPFVCIGMVDNEFWVAPDDFNGSKMATEYLIEVGKKNIAFVTPTVVGGGYQFRYQGYCSAMVSKGFSIREIKTGADPLCEIAAYSYFFSLPVDILKHYDAFVCECDETAIGLIAALKNRGYDVPKDFSVIGYDGLPGISKDLTTMKQDPAAISARATELLSEAAKKGPPRATVIPVTLKHGLTA